MNSFNDVFQDAYNDYFGYSNDNNNLPVNESNIYKDGIVTGINENFKKNDDDIGKTEKLDSNIINERLTAQGHITNVHDACDEIRQLLNVILGQDWGDFAPEKSGRIDVNDIPLPSIRYSTNLREVSPNFSPKPFLLESKKEVINGVPTGDSFDIYKQNFDCIVEFNIRDKTTRSCADIATKFEDILSMHTGLLKKMGVSELFFLKEVPAKYSTYYTEEIPTITLYYYLRLERTYMIKHSVLKDLELQMQIIESTL